MRPPSAVMAAVLVAALLATSACGGDDEPTADPATSSLGTADTTSAATDGTEPTDGTDPPPTADTAPPTDEEAVLAAVDCYWTTIVDANDPPDPDHPGFDRCFTGETLTRVRDDVAETKLLGQTVTDADGIVRFGTEVTWITADSAMVAECFIDDAVLRDALTGNVLNDSVTSYDVEFTVERVDSRWMISDNVATASSEGSDGCDA